MNTVLKVAAGVLLGGALLIGLGALVGVFGGGGSGSSEEITIEAGSEEEADKAVDEAIDDSIGDSMPEEDPGTKYCDGENGDRLTQLESSYNNVTGSPAKVKKLQDTAVALGENAPPGAYCVSSAIDTFIHFWNVSVSDRETQKYNPREQVKQLREFVREGRFDEE